MSKENLFIVGIMLLFSFVLTAARTLVLSSKSAAFDSVTIWQYDQGSLWGWAIVPPVVLQGIALYKGILEVFPFFVAWAVGLAILLKAPRYLLQLIENSKN